MPLPLPPSALAGRADPGRARPAEPGPPGNTKATLGPRPGLRPSVRPPRAVTSGPASAGSAPAMAAPACLWLVFGFSPEEAAGEPGPGPGPWRLEAGPEGISRVWPAWSYVVVETGERPRPARSPGPEPPAGQRGPWPARARSPLPLPGMAGPVPTVRCRAGRLGSSCPPLPLTPVPPGWDPQRSHRARSPGMLPAGPPVTFPSRPPDPRAVPRAGR